MFSCEICEIFKNTYFEEHLRTTASDILVKRVLKVTVEQCQTPWTQDVN